MIYLIKMTFCEFEAKQNIKVFDKEFVSRDYINEHLYIENINRDDSFYHFLIEEENDKVVRSLKNDEYKRKVLEQQSYRPLRYIRHYCKLGDEYVYINVYERYNNITIETLPYSEPLKLDNLQTISLFQIWKIVRRWGFN